MDVPEQPVTFAIDNGVARLVLSRPRKRNALSREMLERLLNAMRSVADDPAVRMLVLSAEGPVFCAGMDLKEMQDRAARPEAAELWHADAQAYRDVIAALVRLSIPALAVVQGPVVAGGVGLVLACDVVLASDSATFALPEPQRGITAAVVAPLVVYRVGAGQATYLLLSGRTLSAQDALRIGLCHELVEVNELHGRADGLCRSILTGAPSALARTKELLLSTAGRQLFADLDAGMRVSAAARETADAREGLAAFLEKRQPAWHLAANGIGICSPSPDVVN
ncbi:MAG TPA: enoyl-CoA hydratase-related protein [Planctomycetaceae bacterium]|nr:enoyl-CoA hydratase-related protein [Planctomycetaceae bacterium]